MSPELLLRSLAGIAALLLAPSFAHAIALVNSAYEPFAYSTTNDGDNTNDGDIGANSGGTGWGATPSAWTDTASTVLNVTSPGLIYPGLPTSGNALNLNAVAPVNGTANTTQNFFRLLNQGGVIDTGTFYFSFLLRKDADSLRTINFAFYSGGTERFAIGQFSPAATFTNGNIGMTQNNAAPPIVGAAPIALTLGVTNLIVGRVDFDVAGTTDRIRLYVNPTLDGSGEPATPYIDVSTANVTGVDQIRPFVGNPASPYPASNGTYDEVRIGATYAAVVPEPGTATLLMLSAGALFRRRRG